MADMYIKKVSKGPLPYKYLRVKLIFEDKVENIEIAVFKHILMKVVQSLFGELATGNIIDVLKYNSKKTEAIIRVQDRFYVKFRSFLTLFGKYDDKDCAFRVLQVSSHLIGLAANSRHWKIETILNLKISEGA